MRHAGLLALLILALAPAASAKPDWMGHQDPAGDGSPDALAVAWAQDTELLVQVELAAAPAADTELHVVWMRGTAGNQTPDEWYVIHVADEARGLAGHSGQVQEIAVNATWTEGVLLLRWTPVDPATAACVVLSAQVGVASPTGFAASDSVPNEPVSQWPSSTCPELMANPQGLATAKGSPGIGLALLCGALLLLALRRRA